MPKDKQMPESAGIDTNIEQYNENTYEKKLKFPRYNAEGMAFDVRFLIIGRLLFNAVV